MLDDVSRDTYAQQGKKERRENLENLDKLSYNQKTDMVVYKSKMTHGKNKKNFSISTAVEFIADITQHIPEKSFQLVRYYGWYSNRMWGERKRLEEGSCAEKQEREAVDISKLTMIDVADYKPRRIPPPLWAGVYPKGIGFAGI